MELIHIQKNIHTAPRKLRLVTDMVRGLPPEEAVEILSFSQKTAALPLIAAIKTALANARMRGKNLTQLYFQSLEINEGPAMKRFRAGSRGRAKPYKRRTSQIRVVLSDQVKADHDNKSQSKMKKEDVTVKEKENRDIKKEVPDGSED